MLIKNHAYFSDMFCFIPDILPAGILWILTSEIQIMLIKNYAYFSDMFCFIPDIRAYIANTFPGC